jgi:hypothetical protein
MIFFWFKLHNFTIISPRLNKSYVQERPYPHRTWFCVLVAVVEFVEIPVEPVYHIEVCGIKVMEGW